MPIILLHTYPYLLLCLFLVALFIAGLIAFPVHRRLMIISGLLSIPFCFYEFAFIPEYWTPSMVGGGKLGLEDMLFSFSTGGIAWIFAAGGIRTDFVINWNLWTFIRRFAGCSLIGVGATMILWLLGLRIMTAVILCIALGIVCLLWRFPHHRNLGFYGAIGFSFIYTLLLSFMFAISPEFLLQWNSHNLSGVTLAGIPAEETFWAFSFAAIWPRFVVYVLNARPLVSPGLKDT